jgi:hypothetical protein
MAVGRCCGAASSTGDCEALLDACMALALRVEYSDRGNEDDQLATCRAYCSAGYAKPLWCDELPSLSPSAASTSSFPVGAAIGGCAGAVVIIVVVVIIVCLYKRREHKGSSEKPKELEDQGEQHDPEQLFSKKDNMSMTAPEEKIPRQGQFEVTADPYVPIDRGCPPNLGGISRYEGTREREVVVPPPFPPSSDTNYETPW